MELHWWIFYIVIFSLDAVCFAMNILTIKRKKSKNQQITKLDVAAPTLLVIAVVLLIIGFILRLLK